jgi:hypothetical protein
MSNEQIRVDTKSIQVPIRQILQLFQNNSVQEEYFQETLKKRTMTNLQEFVAEERDKSVTSGRI